MGKGDKRQRRKEKKKTEMEKVYPAAGEMALWVRTPAAQHGNDFTSEHLRHKDNKPGHGPDAAITTTLRGQRQQDPTGGGLLPTSIAQGNEWRIIQ